MKLVNEKVNCCIACIPGVCGLLHVVSMLALKIKSKKPLQKCASEKPVSVWTLNIIIWEKYKMLTREGKELTNIFYYDRSYWKFRKKETICTLE